MRGSELRTKNVVKNIYDNVSTNKALAGKTFILSRGKW